MGCDQTSPVTTYTCLQECVWWQQMRLLVWQKQLENTARRWTNRTTTTSLTSIIFRPVPQIQVRRGISEKGVKGGEHQLPTVVLFERFSNKSQMKFPQCLKSYTTVIHRYLSRDICFFEIKLWTRTQSR